MSNLRSVTPKFGAESTTGRHIGTRSMTVETEGEGPSSFLSVIIILCFPVIVIDVE